MVLFASVDDVAQTNPVSQPNAMLSLGASDGVAQASTAASDASDVSPSAAAGWDDAAHVFTKPGVAQASLARFESDGFTLRWVANDAAAARICYVALAPP